MKAFHCDQCGSLVFFENVLCVRCQQALGFLPDVIDLSTLVAREEGKWEAVTPAARGRLFRNCENGQQHQACNWLVPAETSDPLCESCRLNEIIPDLTSGNNLELWRKLETAKRRAVYTLLRLKLLGPGAIPASVPLRFRFLNDPEGGPPVMTGHHEGIITLNVAEADDGERERRRLALQEPIRTLLGHLRHELAHYYWDSLVAQTDHLTRFRELFGDESVDYGSALQSYYQKGAPPDWRDHQVSAYASAHPWEDWAETMAHYFHIVDTLETAASFGLALKPKHPDGKAMTADPRKVAISGDDFDRVLKNWLPLTYALNELNRGMGLPDLYPFVLSSPAIDKLRFVHQVINR